MNNNHSCDEIWAVATRKDLAETGGSHNEKGKEFQHHWAVMRMFEIEEKGTEDFLFLFESIQDIAEFDSATNPSSVQIYQVKKKDRKEWTWNDLTGLTAPPSKRKKSKTTDEISLDKLKGSPLGKLYASVIAFKNIPSSGTFISNAGCDLLLTNGENAATALPRNLSDLSLEYRNLLLEGFRQLHEEQALHDLSRVRVERVKLSVEDPGTHLMGIVHKFLESRSPRHVGQAQSLVHSLVAMVSALGAKTDSCKSFDEMRQQRGFSRDKFRSALRDLETIPDLVDLSKIWLARLSNEGLNVDEEIQINYAAAQIQIRILLQSLSKQEEKLIYDCGEWLKQNSKSAQLLPFLDKAYNDLKAKHVGFTKAEIFTHVMFEAIKNART
jgi:Cap4-like dsDNA endonuclease family protein